MRRKNVSTDFIKDCICLSFVQLMKQKPYADISVSEICRHAGFGRTTYYRYFGNDRTELLKWIAQKRWEEYKNAHPEDVKADENNALFVHIFNHHDFFKMLYDNSLTEVVYDMINNAIGPKIEDNEILRYGKSLFVGAYFGVLLEWMRMGCTDTLDVVKNKIQQGIVYAIDMTKKTNECSNAGSNCSEIKEIPNTTTVAAMDEIEIKWGRYRHFKGNEYQVLYIAKHSETLEPMVVYQALYGERSIWVRPIYMWNETVERDGKTCKRFEYVGD